MEKSESLASPPSASDLPPPPIKTIFYQAATAALTRAQTELDDALARRAAALKASANDYELDRLDADIRRKTRAFDHAREQLEAADAEKTRLANEVEEKASLWREKYPAYGERAAAYAAALDQVLAAQSAFIRAADELHAKFDNCVQYVPSWNGDLLNNQFVDEIKQHLQNGRNAYSGYRTGLALAAKEAV